MTDIKINSEVIYQNLAHQIEREDSLVNARISWLLTSEGFLFAALAIVASKDSDPLLKNTLQFTIPIFGFLIALLARRAVLAALDAISILKIYWGRYSLEYGFNHFPQPFGSKSSHEKSANYVSYLPIIIAVMWVVIFISSFIVSYAKGEICS